jgi:excisionase family DNA binding protein
MRVSPAVHDGPMNPADLDYSATPPNRRLDSTPPRLLTVVEAGRLLGVGRTTVYDLIARGELCVVHIGRAARVTVASVDSFVARLLER